MGARRSHSCHHARAVCGHCFSIRPAVGAWWEHFPSNTLSSGSPEEETAFLVSLITDGILVRPLHEKVLG